MEVANFLENYFKKTSLYPLNANPLIMQVLGFRIS